MAKTARHAAIETLQRNQRTGHPVARIFSGIVEQCRLSSTDRQLAMNIVYGVLRHRDQLDLLISRLCSRSPSRQNPFVYQALAVGLYQIFFLERIPGFAAVHETVEAVRRSGTAEKLCGFVNGVLRSGLRRRDELYELIDPEGAGRGLLNHPAWLTRRWQAHFGEQTMRAICAYNNREATLNLRLSRSLTQSTYLKLLQEEGIEAHAGEFAPDSVVLPCFHGSISALPGYHEGLFFVQDQAAQLATLLLAPFWPGRSYLDCCAGLGGKTSYLADLTAAGDASLTAVEPDPGRFRLLGENLARTVGDHTLSLHNSTLEHFARTCPLHFDAILVDAPCSGTGVIGRHPDIRWNRQEQDLLFYREKQGRLLETAADLLAPGGVLVYATCSIEPEENRQVVDRFIADHHGFMITNCDEYLPAPAQALVADGCFAPLPSSGCDGFFAARLTSDGER
ncbi:MAG: 16S rRNA (cytosine(967)-C(5))-methyltransferase RsmB [Desulfofustis sp.]|jgi:16S rRNA (cytosine967-C5)-methyltransferase|nr:16S rRNA (cytosine(967)-C(5))-methyltransferase RsmB [Desulfofustis sp.]